MQVLPLHKLQTTNEGYLMVQRHISTGNTWSSTAHVNRLLFCESFPRASAAITGNEAAVFSQARKTRAIWWWNDVLSLHHEIITCAILQLRIC